MGNSRVRNISVAVVLFLIYLVPAFWFSGQTMLDIVSIPMLFFGLYLFYVVAEEAVLAFWDGRADKVALGLFGLLLLFLSVDIMRPYGIISRNVDGAKDWLDQTHIYGVAVYIQFIGLYLFTRGATPSQVDGRRPKWGQLVAGVIIGLLLATSKIVEPVVAFIGKLFSRLI